MKNLFLISFNFQSIGDIKAGFAGNTEPRYSIEPIVGIEVHHNVTAISQEQIIGPAAAENKSKIFDFSITCISSFTSDNPRPTKRSETAINRRKTTLKRRRNSSDQKYTQKRCKRMAVS